MTDQDPGLRIVEVRMDDSWMRCHMADIRKGDTFRFSDRVEPPVWSYWLAAEDAAVREWRALGHELIEQEYVYYHHNEDGTYHKWKAVAWVDPPPSITLKGRS